MKYVKEYFVPVILVLLSLFALCVFRTAPASRLWNGYSVLYIPAQSDFRVVEEIFDNTGCDKIITIENQFVPLNVSENSPEVSLSLSSIEKSDYLLKRNLYFFDKSHRYKVCYVPDKQKQNAQKAVLEMNKNGIAAGMNVKAVFPFIVPLVCLAFAVVLIIFSRRKVLCALLLFIPLVFSFSQPFYASAAIICLFMYGVYISIMVWDRRGAVQYLLRSIVLISFLLLSVIAAFLTGLKCAFLFVLMAFGVVALAKFSMNVLKFFNERYSFSPVKIIPARMISLSTKKSNFALLICALAVVVVFVVSSLTTSVSASTNSSASLLLPGPAYSSGGNFPTINDYVEWKWEAMTFPYISLNGDKLSEKPKAGDRVVFTEYTNEGGFIKSTEKSIEYNSNFISNSIKGVDDFDYPAIEKFLKAQKNTSTGYVSAGMQTLNFATMLVLSITFIICMFFYFVQKYLDKAIILRGIK